MEKVSLFGMNFISMSDYDDLLWELEHRSDRDQPDLPVLITPNVDQTVKYHQPKHSSLFQRISKARYILPDGKPLVWVSRFKRERLKARLTGSDFFRPLWRHIRSAQKSVSFVLSSDDIAEHLRKEYPEMRHYVPPFYSITTPVNTIWWWKPLWP